MNAPSHSSPRPASARSPFRGRLVLLLCLVAAALALPGCGNGTTVKETRWGNGQIQTRLTVRPVAGGGFVNDGPYVTYYENGQVREEGTYKLGLVEGPVTHYHENGQKKAYGTYHEGRLQGAWQAWDKHGKPIEAASEQEMPEPGH